MIWIGLGVLLAIALCIFFLPSMLRSIHINAGYWAWRLSGGVKSISNGKKLWEAYGLSSPYLLTVGQKSTFFLPLPNGKVNKGVEYINLNDRTTFLSRNPNSDDNLRSIDVTFKNVFSINPKNVKIGCHGIYCLPKAVYLSHQFGGDPVCGGGLKHRTASFPRMALESFRLHRKLKNKQLQVFAKVFENGSSGVIYHNDIPRGFLELLLGEETAVKEYAKRIGTSIKSVQIEFA